MLLVVLLGTVELESLKYLAGDLSESGAAPHPQEAGSLFVLGDGERSRRVTQTSLP